MGKAQQRLSDAEANLAAARQELDRVRSRRRIKCHCGKLHAIRDLDLIVTHFYIEPHGCTGGDYWSEGEWNFVCKDGVRNRLLFDDYNIDWQERDNPNKAAGPAFKWLYRRLFKSRVDEYEERLSGGFNNYYVCAHRKRFELPAKPERA